MTTHIHHHAGIVPFASCMVKVCKEFTSFSGKRVYTVKSHICTSFSHLIYTLQCMCLVRLDGMDADI